MTRKKFFIILLICIAIFTIIIFITKYIDNRKQDAVSNVLKTIKIDESMINETTTERMLQVAELRTENSDIVGWIEIPETTINYPVLQGNDNDYYLTHTYKGDYSKNGSIFLDMNYNFEIPSSNLLIYGHNNKSGKMFEELLQYQDESYYKKHPTIRFTTEKDDSEYDIIAVFKSRVYYTNETNVFRYYFFINAKTKAEYDNYILESKRASLYNINSTAKYGDQLLTLSTCDYSRANGRFVVVARKVLNNE